jgi:hypothetical protein
MDSENIALRWEGPFHWFSDQGATIVSGPLAEAAGIYVWGVPHRDAHLVYYVGQTEAGFGPRHYDHFRAYASGLYTVHDAARFAKGALHQIYGNRPYARDPWRRAQPFVDDFEKLATEIAAMMRAMRIFVAPMARPRRIHRRVEGAMVQLLNQAEPARYRFQEPAMRMQLSREDETPILVTLEPRGLLLGLPDEFTA